MTPNGLQLVWEACSYLESPRLPFDPIQNERIHPTVEVGEIKENSSESNNCKGNEFQNPEENTSPRPPYLGGGGKHHIRGTIQLAFLPSVGKGAPGRNQKFRPIKEVFKDVMFSLPLPPPPPPPQLIATAFTLATHKCIDLPFFSNRQNK